MLLYELCALQHPFDASGLHQLIIKISQGIRAPIPKTYSADLQKLVDLLLTLNYQKRPSINQILKQKIVFSRI